MIDKGVRAMTPQFSSPELNHLLQLELTEGAYRSPEDALLAGLKTLRQSRERDSQFADRLASLSDGRAIVLDGDGQLADFLDAIDAEVDTEIEQHSRRKI
jgi:hypothetical protein